MGLFDGLLDAFAGENTGSFYRMHKAVKEAEKAEIQHQMDEERRHQEILAALKGGRRNDDFDD